ncbi:acetoacetate--CoA ligase [Mesorhizobium sp. SP-1A]|uniref:acetoacetate--CoA ligase n=1 Tax=Mesorhizobium sp. SP-1A TaxID=3077840 RepID=UPI0028F6DA43|nr:acetoacetate--CoA ligase [Mesorhizobium sp. SP-1A]
MNKGQTVASTEIGDASAPLWAPSPAAVRHTAMDAFQTAAAAVGGHDMASYGDLHCWSVDDRSAFWSLVWDYCGIIGDKGARVLSDGAAITKARFFPDARLNFTENLLRSDGASEAIVFRAENGETRRVTREELRGTVSKIRQFLVEGGLREGDRVVAVMPNLPETIAVMLAVASLGAVWASCSPDFGAQGILDRFQQVEPVFLVSCDGYYYNGKRHQLRDKIAEVAASIPSLKQTIIVDFIGEAEAASAAIANSTTLERIIEGRKDRQIVYERFPFSQPLYILFSSGTTGKPKCIVHSAGGTLIQHLKEHRLHCDIHSGDRLFYFTTCAWMMWNWLASALASGATLMLYDGSPFHPNGETLFKYAQEERITHFGTSAKFIESVKKGGIEPGKCFDLSKLRVLMSTGSPLSIDSYAFVYEAIKPDIHLVSMSGGTDIVSCFVLGAPILPVWAGEIQAAGLGMAVEVWDDDAKRIWQQKGELVCTSAFPSMPLGFWNDKDGQKYLETYFSRFDNVWCHGDFAEQTSHGGFVIHGRSDTTLNPGGVRVGTAEIYNQIDKMVEIADAVCVGQDFDGDVRVVLFVRLSDNCVFDQDLVARIKARIRQGATPRHVPSKIVAVAEIPRTKTGKIAEIAVRDTIHGRVVRNVEALANPESLKLFESLAELSA